MDDRQSPFNLASTDGIDAIKTEAEYEAVLERITTMIEAEPGSPEGDELELLAMLVEAYEAGR